MATYNVTQLAQGSDLIGPLGIPQPYPTSQLFGVFIAPNLPTVVGQYPAPGTVIVPTTPITFQVQGATGKYTIDVQYPSGLWETAWNGSTFAPFYIGGSGFIAAPPGSTGFSLMRTGGWLQAPTVAIGTGF